MGQTKEHYEKHLAHIYSWMVGSLESKSLEFKAFLIANDIKPSSTKTAIDLGAGNGIQSLAMNDLGFQVTAIDFNQQLLNELKANPNGKGIKTELADITKVAEYEKLKPELIICCGDTITHLEDIQQIEKLILDAANIIQSNGHIILSFRDYTQELNDQQRFIAVKSTENRILTCILEFEPEKIRVSDLLHERINKKWTQKVGTYEKVRISPLTIIQFLKKNGMKIKLHKQINNFYTIVARKTTHNNGQL